MTEGNGQLHGGIDQEFVPVTIGKRQFAVPVPMVLLCIMRAEEGAAQVAAPGAKHITMVEGALKVIQAALSLTAKPPVLHELQATLRPDEFQGTLEAFTAIMRASGFTGAPPTGEALAAGPTSDELSPS